MPGPSSQETNLVREANQVREYRGLSPPNLVREFRGLPPPNLVR